MNLNKLRDEIHSNAVEKGFWANVEKSEFGTVDVAAFVNLAVGELSEAVEADRKGLFAKSHVSPFGGSLVWDLDTTTECKGHPAELFGRFLKDTFEDEFADAFIRLLDLAGGLNIDLNVIRSNALPEYEHNFDKMSFHGKIQVLSKSILSLVSPLGYSIDESFELTSRFHFLINTFLSFAEEFKLNLFRHVELKNWFNRSRAYLHGKKY
jgi:NTP pyrophosphatase (non-canonical NTP hydrolase)